MSNICSLDYIKNFYINQPNQINKIKLIQDWFKYINELSINNKKFINSNKLNSNVLLLIGTNGMGKSNIIQIFLKESNLDVIDIGKLFDIYESNNSYTTKDFIPKILKQKNVSNYENINKKKLLVIDSLEEFMATNKSIIKEIIENFESLNMPIVIGIDKNCFDELEKKTTTKLLKSTYIVELERPSQTTIQNYINSILKLNYKIDDIQKLYIYSKGDIRYINNMLSFQSLIKKYNQEPSFIHGNIIESLQEQSIKNIGENQKDLVIDVESSLKDIGTMKFSNTFSICETDPFIFGMLTYENYIYNNNKYPEYKRNYIIKNLCYADEIEKNLFRYQQWELLEIYSYFSTIYPWRLLDTPKTIHPSTTLQKFLNTKKRNKKYDLPF